ncbi:Fe-S cluster assembly protein SufD [Alphaproteobacteria bacterium KMM 3653]|uniref:Fe-S cluster assembly protein SufD n=1 Tax=Harenicola maris TaxID=2841044 RepID=A0AAP2CN97_9RHOB|nr:Fe-S cluster assembly protein SufD [Harenicola maris]
MAAAVKHPEVLAAKLASMTVPEGGAWASEARKTAQARTEATGLPARSDEYWKYTRPDAWTAPEAGFSGALPASDVLGEGAVTLYFVDGVFDAEASDDPAIAGASVELLSAAAAADLHWAKDLYGVLEQRGQSPVARPMAALNTAFAAQGVVIHVTGKAEKPLRICYRSTGGECAMHHLIKLDKGADLTLLEEGAPAARSNIVMEVEVADGAAFHHVRLQGPEDARQTLSHIFARLGTESELRSFTLSVNGAMTRNEAVVELTGDDAKILVGGAAVGDGAFHHDDTVFITHDAVNCESRQVFKKVLRNGATGVFQGKILVKPDAQKTDGYQISQSLLLDDDSQFLAKPELEIYADDVACSHGSTSGAIDEEALFYLRSRGVPEGDAQDLLVLAFLAEAMEEIEDESLAETLTEQLAVWMKKGR